MTRVYEIAKEVGIPNKDLIAKIRALGLEVNNHMSSLDPNDVVRIKRSLEKEKQSVAAPAQTTKASTSGAAVLRRRSAADKGEADVSVESKPVAPPPAAAPAPAPAPVVRRRAVGTEDSSIETKPVAPPMAEAPKPAPVVAAPPPPPVVEAPPRTPTAPVEAKPAPVVDTPARTPAVPVVETPKPAPVVAAPPVEAPKPAPVEVKPVVAEAPKPAPVVEAPKPAPVAAKPAVVAPPTPPSPSTPPTKVADTVEQPTGERPRGRVIVAGPQVVARPGDTERGTRVMDRTSERVIEREPPPSTPLPPRSAQTGRPAETTPPPSTRSVEVDMTGHNPRSARTQFEMDLERARARTADRPEPARPMSHTDAFRTEAARTEAARSEDQQQAAPAAPARDPSRPAVGSIIALPPRIKITERGPMGGRPAPGPAPANPIRGRFAQQQQRGGPRGPGGRPGMGNDFGRKKLPLGKKGKQTTLTTPADHKRVIRIEDSITVSDLARGMGVKAPEVLKKLWGMGMTGVNINASIDFDTAQLLANEFQYEVQNVAFKEDDIFTQKSTEDAELVVRAPVVTVMGHVDHGKTSLLDSIRKARVAAGESGGITQHVAAYKVAAPGHGDIVFLDTPGHEAFTEMRARGAQATDIVVLVVAANDGVMPQTLEALAHAKDAKVSIIVAVNKIDLADAQPDRIRQQLADHGLIPEEWGGETMYVNVSALRHENIDKLLEGIAVTAEVLELRASPSKPAAGLVIEARLDRNRGPSATVLVQEGTLRVGDIVVAGRTYGKVRAMLDDRGNSVDEAGPSTPVEVLGLDGVPEAGDQVNVAEDDKVAKTVVEYRRQAHRKRELASSTRISLEGMMERNSADAIKELKIVLKADVQGSAEAIKASLLKQSTEKVRVVVIQAGVGGITESDVNLAKAGGAIIIGFHVRPAGKSAKLAEQEEVEIRLYDIIYDMLDEVKAAMAGLLAPIKREVPLGHAEVRETFAVPKIGVVAGCMIQQGKITRKAHLRLIRDAVQVYEGKVGSLRRFKDDVAEVGNGFECGIMIAGYNDVKIGDIIEAYEVVEEAAKL